MSLEARAGLGKAGLTDIAVLVQNLFNVRIMQPSELHQIGRATGMVVENSFEHTQQMYLWFSTPNSTMHPVSSQVAISLFVYLPVQTRY